MTTLYSNNFDAETVGTLPTGWVNVLGAWTVQATDPVSGPNVLGVATASAHVLYNGGSAQGNQNLTFSQKLIDVNQSNVNCPILHTNADGSGGVMFMPYPDGAGHFALKTYRRFGSWQEIATSSNTADTWAAGDVMILEEIAIPASNLYECRMWKSGNARPSAATASYTNTDFATGKFGFFRSMGGSASAVVGIDDLVYTDNAAAAATAVTISLSASSAPVGTPITVTVGTDNPLTGAQSESIALTAPVAGTFSTNPVTLNAGTATATPTFTASATGTGNITGAATGTPTLSNGSAAYTATSSATVPAAPTIGTAVAGNGYVDVAYTNNGNGGSAILDNTATLSTGETATGTTSPIRVTAANGTARTGTVKARNAIGLSAASGASNSVTPSGSGAATFPVTDPSLFFSPYVWYSDGAGAMQANNIKASSAFAWSGMRGAYLKFRATVGAAGTISLAIDTTTLAGLTAAGCPQLAWCVGNAAPQSQLLASGNTSVSLATGLSAGTYEVFVWFRGVYITQDGGAAQNYTAINNRVQITAVNLSTGGTLSASSTVKGKRKAVYGDSVTEGDLSNGGPRSATSQNALYTYGWMLSQILDAEVGIIGFYGQQWTWLDATWSNHAAGFSRLVGGLLSPAPDYVIVNYGENGSVNTVTSAATLAAISAAAPASKIILLVPFSGTNRTAVSAIGLPSNGYRIDLARPEILPGKTQWSYDGQHPNQEGHSNLAALLGKAINSLSAPALVSRTVTISLKLDATTPAANLTGVKVAFWDEISPDLATTARYQSGVQTTNSSGVLTFSVNSTLASGGTGYIDIRAPGGLHYCGPMAVT